MQHVYFIASLTNVQRNIAKDRIAKLSPIIAAANGFVRFYPSNTDPYISQPPTPNGISTGSPRFAQIIRVPNIQTDTQIHTDHAIRATPAAIGRIFCTRCKITDS